ncbi:MAG: T9SS type A sorting domain-containing protein, partial [Candidatus Krumholzibacteria bacterium]|nr:T9SS type A sorting domain-containing protein [Candidatus Krumholzibacteria bacterium]
DPQDVTGDLIQYDCTAKYLDGDYPVINYQHFLPVVDVPAEYTWDNPGGIGWSYFPATPDNRLRNNPNVNVGVHFTGAIGFWLKEDLRINGITATNDLTVENYYTTNFIYPIPECGGMELRVEYQYPNRYGSPIWFPLNTHKITGASNADLVVDPLNTINLSDLVAFSLMMGTCEGDLEYSPCADFFPSGCINLTDLQILTEIYSTDPNKNGELAVFQGDVWLSGIEESTRDCIIKTEVTWDAAIVRFKLPIKDPSEIIWSPSRPFVDRSVLVSNKSDDGIIFSLVILGPSEAGTIELGTLSSASLDVLDRIQFLSTEIGSAEKPFNKTDSPVSLSTSLGNASPNPFNPMTTISFDLLKQASVRMVIYDVSGRLTRTLIDGEIVATGRHEIVWNGRDDMGKQVAAGVYFYRLDTDEYSETKRMALVK